VNIAAGWTLRIEIVRAVGPLSPGEIYQGECQPFGTVIVTLPTRKTVWLKPLEFKVLEIIDRNTTARPHDPLICGIIREMDCPECQKNLDYTDLKDRP
jgi:hypothetical protein